MKKLPKYNTWIRKNKIITFWCLTILFLSSSVLGIFHPALSLFGVLCLPFGYIAIVISLSAYRFSSKGDDYQNKIHRVIIDEFQRSGNVLDIGCGSGKLIISLALNNPELKCIGLDFWGSNWEYSKQQCIENAEIEGASNIEFAKSSASKLPFPDAQFSNIISCLTFHEVADVPDKTESIKEAFRVLQSNGTFTFFDLFEDTSFYKSLDDVKKAITDSCGEILRFRNISEIMDLKYPLNTGKVLKYGVFISGKKK
jgi:ubiquinone/menaquinone biosynthesis C-methylase UbiE